MDSLRGRHTLGIVDTAMELSEHRGKNQRGVFEIDFEMDCFKHHLHFRAVPGDHITGIRRSLGYPPLDGIWTVDGVRSGITELKNSNAGFIVLKPGERAEPVTASRPKPIRPDSAVVVSGIPNCEIVLEEFHSLPRQAQKQLPKTPSPETFIGSLRAEDAVGNPFEKNAAVIVLAVTLTVFLRPLYFPDSTN